MICNYLSLGLFGFSACFLAGNIAVEAIINANPVGVINWQIHNYQVSVQIHNNHVCGGGIIGDRFVLTAAHCFLANHTHQLCNPNIAVLAGTYNLHSTGPPAVIIPVEKIFVPRDYHTQDRMIFVGDIAVLQLVHSLPLEHSRYNMRKLLLPRNNPPHMTFSYFVAGFGWSTKEIHENSWLSTMDGRLRYSAVRIISPNMCKESYPHGEIESDLHYCTYTRRDLTTPSYGPHGVCIGDDGAPLVDHDGTIIYGILSRIPDDCDDLLYRPNDVLPMYPVYTRISHYARNIHNVMEHGYDWNMIEHANL